jgi:lipopolysaccharide export system permease protein
MGAVLSIHRYVSRQLIAAILVVVVSLTCVIWLSQSLRFVDMIVNRGLPLSTFIYLTVLLMPSFLSVVLPVACFAGVLFVYNRMISDREMVVMAATGVSPLGLARAALGVTVVATILCYALMLYLLPLSYRGFKDLQFKIRNNYTDILLREGVFNSIGDGLTVYVRSREANGELTGIIVNDDRDSSETVTLIAERGALVITESGPRVFMLRGNRQARDHATGRVKLLYFERYTVDLGQLAEAMQRTFREQNELFVGELLNPDARITDPKNFREFVAEGHFRLTAPLLPLALTAIGLCVLLRAEFSRQGQTMRLVLAVALAGLMEAVVLGSKYLAAREPAFIPAMYAAVLLPPLICLGLIARPRLRRPAAMPADALGAG